jgi:hypothetical protein
MKSEAACVGMCLYDFSFWVGYSAALGRPLNIRRNRERIDPRLRLPKQSYPKRFEDLEDLKGLKDLKDLKDLKEVGNPFMMLVSGIKA